MVAATTTVLRPLLCFADSTYADAFRERVWRADHAPHLTAGRAGEGAKPADKVATQEGFGPTGVTANAPEAALQNRSELLRLTLTRLSPEHREIIDLRFLIYVGPPWESRRRGGGPVGAFIWGGAETAVRASVSSGGGLLAWSGRPGRQDTLAGLPPQDRARVLRWQF